MFDEFDIIDFVFGYVKQADTGLPIYKDKSPKGEKGNHIVINHLQFVELDFLDKLPININIFYRQHEKNGMTDRSVKEVKRRIANSIKTITHTNGQYRKVKIEFSQRIPDFKEGFDCTNIRIVLTTDKN